MTTERALQVAARLGLPGIGDDGGPAPVANPDVTGMAQHQGVAGFLVAAQRAGEVSLPDPDAALSAWHDALLGCVMVEALAVRTAELLDTARVRWRLTKGAAFAHLDYPDQLACRTFGDADIIVHVDDWERAVTALERAGHHRPASEIHHDFDRRFGKGATFNDPNGLEVDVHLRFAVGRFGLRAEMGEIFDRPGDHIELAGRRLPCLDGPDRLLHATHHLVLGGFSGLRVARDVAQHILVAEHDWTESVRRATGWGVQAIVAAAITEAWARLDLQVDHPAPRWASSYEMASADAEAIAVFRDERTWAAQARTGFGALGAADKARYASALAASRIARPQRRARR